jgi:hypothetical protein
MKKLLLIIGGVVIVLIVFFIFRKNYKVNNISPYYKEILNKSQKTQCDFLYIEYMNNKGIISVKEECPDGYIETYIPKLMCVNSSITIEMDNWCVSE